MSALFDFGVVGDGFFRTPRTALPIRPRIVNGRFFPVFRCGCNGAWVRHFDGKSGPWGGYLIARCGLHAELATAEPPPPPAKGRVRRRREFAG
jgi:hypothetical protein